MVSHWEGEQFITVVQRNRHPVFKAVTAVRSRAISYAKSVSLPYPEPGVRLLRQDRIDQFDVQMREFREELGQTVRKLDDHYADLRQAARERLGTLYDPSNYPDSLIDMFSMEWDFPAVEPPDYLRQLNPQLYEQECQRVQARFDDAVRLAEEAFTGELAKIVSHLTERLSGQVDGHRRRADAPPVGPLASRPAGRPGRVAQSPGKRVDGSVNRTAAGA